jgi:uncharacterized protein (DUF488 family)
MKVYTIGFTKTSAQHFFGRLKDAGVGKVVDVRLHNVSQLAGFAKKDDLRYFLQAIGNIGYEHHPELAPTEEMLQGFRAAGGVRGNQEQRFLDLLAERQVERTLAPETLDRACLLCSEDKPHHCHRRLVADYLKSHWGNVDVIHL